jgi:hypothetical protein
MPKDADGNYYYDEGTIAEQFDNWEIYEDEDGSVGFLKDGNELRFSEASVLFGNERGPPDETELEAGEKMMYVSNGDGANSTSGDVVIARNDGGTIEEAVITLSYSAI